MASSGMGHSINKKRPTAVSSTLQFRWVSAGDSYTCAISTASKAYCWGYNGSGVLGDGATLTDRWTPTLVSGGLSEDDPHPPLPTLVGAQDRQQPSQKIGQQLTTTPSESAP